MYIYVETRYLKLGGVHEINSVEFRFWKNYFSRKTKETRKPSENVKLQL